MSKVHSNKIIFASAGSRKTTYIVDQALLDVDRNVLILTYTIDNIEQIRSYIIAKQGFIPTNITIKSWFSFLLQDCVRPYQNYVYGDKRIETVFFPDDIQAFKLGRRFIRKDQTKFYFFVSGKYIINEHVSEFVCMCNDTSGGKVISRLEGIYQKIFIDEIQDISGYDFDVIELLQKSRIDCCFVGDCRQATFFTTCSPKYKRFKGKNIIHLFKDWEKKGLCAIEEKNECFRSNQIICDFADKIFPELSKTVSFNNEETEHSGLFIVKSAKVSEYVRDYKPVILRFDKRTDTLGLEARNFGASKGLTFMRVLIFPPKTFSKYLKDGQLTKIKRTKNKRSGSMKEEIVDSFHKPKLYVGITRAKASVAFVFDGVSAFDELKEY